MTDEAVGGVVKVIELVGSSPESFSDAVRNAVKTASKTIRHITGVDVLSSSAECGDGGSLVNYKVHCKIAFLVEQSLDGEGDGAVSVAATGSTSAPAARAASPGAA